MREPLNSCWRRTIAASVAAFAAGTFVLGCMAKEPDDSQQRGELGGTFGEECEDPSRNVCNANPSRDGVALGSTFTLVYEPKDKTATVERIEPVSEEQLTFASDGRLVAHREGLAGLIVRKPLGDVVDYTFVHVKKAARIILVTPASDLDLGDVSVVGSSELVMRLQATDASPLLGFVPVEVSVTNPELVTVTSVRDDRITLTSKGKGQTELVIQGAGLERRIGVHTGTGATE